MLPFVSIIIPCRNEKRHIAHCLTSLVHNDYPKECLEVFVADGMSTDSTRAIVKTFAQNYPFIQLVDNEKRIAATALNLCIKKARGKIIMRMDAHTEYPKNYISACVTELTATGADNVGGIIETRSPSQKIIGNAIALVLSHPFGVGNSPFRVKSTTPREVDTVPFGCYKRAVFDNIGPFNEELERSQDMEFNRKLKKQGGKIILIPSIVITYFAPDTLLSFLFHSFRDGLWALYPIKFTGKLFAPRHYVAFLFVLFLIVCGSISFFFPPVAVLFKIALGVYATFDVLASLQSALRSSNPLTFILLIFFFPLFHISYGIGSLVGAFKLLLPKPVMLHYGNTKTRRN